MASGLAVLEDAASPAVTVAAAYRLGDDWQTGCFRFGHERARHLGRIAARYARLVNAGKRYPQGSGESFAPSMRARGAAHPIVEGWRRD